MIDGMKILVGTDGSQHSTLAFMEAMNVAQRFSGFIKVITVYKQGMEKEAKKILEDVERALKEKAIRYEVTAILGSNPSRALTTVAKHEKFDLIVVGSRGLGSAASILLGSISKKIVSSSPCDVLVVKK